MMQRQMSSARRKERKSEYPRERNTYFRTGERPGQGVSNALLPWENQHRQAYGKYFDAMQASISSAAAKEAWFKVHIWGL